MKQAELISAVQKKMTDIVGEDVSKAEAKEALEAVFGVIEDTLMVPGGSIQIGTLGKLQLDEVSYKARKGRNPRTGAELDIPARETVRLKFTPSKGKTSVKVRAEAAYEESRRPKPATKKTRGRRRKSESKAATPKTSRRSSKGRSGKAKSRSRK